MLFYHNCGIRVWLLSVPEVPSIVRLYLRTAFLFNLVFCTYRSRSLVGFGVMTSTAPGLQRIRLSAWLVLALLAAAPAHAFRWGNRVVIENMHEQQVLNACGEPAAIRHLGYTLRDISRSGRHRLSFGRGQPPYWGFNNYVEEVVVTEYIYNFGPRKFMRRLIFEGSILVTIESIGYGYRKRGN